jgi:hypothetical protein
MACRFAGDCGTVLLCGATQAGHPRANTAQVAGLGRVLFLYTRFRGRHSGAILSGSTSGATSELRIYADQYGLIAKNLAGEK